MIEAGYGDYIGIYAYKRKIIIAKQTKMYNRYDFEAVAIEKKDFGIRKRHREKIGGVEMERIESNPAYIEFEKEQMEAYERSKKSMTGV